LNLNLFLAKSLLAVFVFVGIFFVQASLVNADKFEVTLQTSFAKPPETCDGSGKDDYINADEKGSNGYNWVCKAGSREWTQIVTGDNGNEILINFASMLYRWLAGFIGVVAVLMLVVGGIQISTAGANQEGLQDGQNRILAALVGLALLFLSSLILYTINPNFFGGG
jgi:hypothetical protein